MDPVYRQHRQEVEIPVLPRKRPAGGSRLGMEVDRIVGLVDGAAAVAHGEDPIAERRSIDDRVACQVEIRRGRVRLKLSSAEGHVFPEVRNNSVGEIQHNGEPLLRGTFRPD